MTRNETALSTVNMTPEIEQGANNTAINHYMMRRYKHVHIRMMDNARKQHSKHTSGKIKQKKTTETNRIHQDEKSCE